MVTDGGAAHEYAAGAGLGSGHLYPQSRGELMAADGVITVSGAARGPHGSPGPPPTETRVDTCTAHVTRR